MFINQIKIFAAKTEKFPRETWQKLNAHPS